MIDNRLMHPPRKNGRKAAHRMPAKSPARRPWPDVVAIQKPAKTFFAASYLVDPDPETRLIIRSAIRFIDRLDLQAALRHYQRVHRDLFGLPVSLQLKPILEDRLEHGPQDRLPVGRSFRPRLNAVSVG